MPIDVDRYLEAIERELRAVLRAPEPESAALYQMMHYHMGWLDERLEPAAPRGKRLRPLVCVLVCDAMGGDWARALPGAAALELIHGFSLIHDDIEDNSETRRHRPTVWRLWGLAQGLNAGDAMWAVSRLATYRLLDRDYSPALVLNVARCLDDTCLQLCTGQYLDLHFEGESCVTVAEYQQMIAGKTAALISASASVGALLAEVQEADVRRCAALGLDLGIAFQVVDDILGIWGDPAVTGKSAASDILERKKTLPIVFCLEQEAERGRADLRDLLASPELGDADVGRARSLVERSGALEYSRALAVEHHRRALESLESTSASGAARRCLEELVSALLDRET